MHPKLVLVAALAQQCSQYVVFSLFCYTVLGFTSYLSTFGFSFAFSWKSDSIFGGWFVFHLLTSNTPGAFDAALTQYKHNRV